MPVATRPMSPVARGTHPHLPCCARAARARHNAGEDRERTAVGAAGGGHAAARPRTFTFAPEPRAPATMLAWLSASLRMRQPRPTSAGMTMLFVAKPMPNVSAAGLPTKSATSASSSRCTGVVPAQGGALSGFGKRAQGPRQPRPAFTVAAGAQHAGSCAAALCPVGGKALRRCSAAANSARQDALCLCPSSQWAATRPAARS